jgi:hypothetical protein
MTKGRPSGRPFVFHTPKNTGFPVLWREWGGSNFASMNMIRATMNGDLRPTPATEAICRVALFVAVSTLVVLMIVTFTGQ